MNKIIELLNNGYNVIFERNALFGVLIKVEDFNQNSFTSALPFDGKHITVERIEKVLDFNVQKIIENNYGK